MERAKPLGFSPPQSSPYRPFWGWFDPTMSNSRYMTVNQYSNTISHVYCLHALPFYSHGHVHSSENGIKVYEFINL